MEIPNWENYTIDFNGNVYSKKNKKFLIPWIRENRIDNRYLVVNLYMNRKRKTIDIHRLMALTYLPNYYGLPQIDHKDRNSLNNNLFNLKWVSRSENGINKKMYKNKKIPFRHIGQKKEKNKYEYWTIRILRNKVFIFSKRFAKSTYTLDEVVKFRNEIYKELNIIIDD